MQENVPPFSIVVPGKVFRPDATDASHSFMFHQVEGLVVSKDINFANLKMGSLRIRKSLFWKIYKGKIQTSFLPIY